MGGKKNPFQVDRSNAVSMYNTLSANIASQTWQPTVCVLPSEMPSTNRNYHHDNIIMNDGSYLNKTICY